MTLLQHPTSSPSTYPGPPARDGREPEVADACVESADDDEGLAGHDTPAPTEFSGNVATPAITYPHGAARYRRRTSMIGPSTDAMDRERLLPART